MVDKTKQGATRRPAITRKVTRGLGSVYAFLEAQANAGEASELFSGASAAEQSEIDAAIWYIRQLSEWHRLSRK